jgi:hypothetical protein
MNSDARKRLVDRLRDPMNTPQGLLVDSCKEAADELARLSELEADAERLSKSLGHAIEIIDKHVANDALGMNWSGGGDGWNTESWPIKDEFLHYMRDDLAKHAALAATRTASAESAEGGVG